MAAPDLVQYIVVRGDLLRTMSWPLGAIIAQACHASTAVLQLYKSHEDTEAYLENLENMHKVVLEAKDEAELKDLSNRLFTNEIDHKLWIEQPEDYPTCLALRPYPKAQVQSLLKGFKLYKK